MKDLTDLPSNKAAQGEPPVANPLYGRMLADEWFETHRDTWKKVSDTPLHNSQAGKCGRAMSYEALGQEETNPSTIADSWRFNLGSRVHELAQVAMMKARPKATAEVGVTIEGITSGRIDLVDEHDSIVEGHRLLVALEMKTVNGFAFKKMIGARGEAEGPRAAWKLQGALGGYGLNAAYGRPADLVVIIALSLENLSPRELEKLLRGLEENDVDPQLRRFIAEWHYPKEVYLPWAEAELDRMAAISVAVADGRTAPRHLPEMPKGAQVDDPMKGLWTLRLDNGDIIDSGRTWLCDYCSFRDRCIKDGK